MFYNHKFRRKNNKIINPFNWIDKSEFDVYQFITWLRHGSPDISSIKFITNTENIFWLIKNKPFFNSRYFKYGEVWNIKFDVDTIHPAPFPLEIPKRCINSCTTFNNLVLDPFLGSGTTAVACKMLNRNFIGFEISKEYCDMTNNRLAKCKMPSNLKNFF